MSEGSSASKANVAQANASLVGPALWLGLGVAALGATLYGGLATAPAPAAAAAAAWTQKVSAWPEIVPSSPDAPAASDGLAPTP